MGDSNTNTGTDNGQDNSLLNQAFNFAKSFFQKPDDEKPGEQEYDATKMISTAVGLFGGAKFGGSIMSKLFLTLALGAVAYFATNWIKDHFNLNASGDNAQAKNDAKPAVSRYVYDPAKSKLVANPAFVAPALDGPG